MRVSRIIERLDHISKSEMFQTPQNIFLRHPLSVVSSSTAETLFRQNIPVLSSVKNVLKSFTFGPARRCERTGRAVRGDDAVIVVVSP